MIFLLYQAYPQKKEQFVDIDKEIKSLTMESDKTLKNFREDSTLFSQFCKKLKYFDDNYNQSSKIFQLNKDLKKNIRKTKKETERSSKTDI